MEFWGDALLGLGHGMARPLQSLEPGSVGAWLAVPQTQRGRGYSTADNDRISFWTNSNVTRIESRSQTS